MLELLISLVPTMVIQGLLLVAIIPLARRLSPRGWWRWLVLALVPAVGAVAFMLLMMKALGTILERIDGLERACNARASGCVSPTRPA